MASHHRHGGGHRARRSRAGHGCRTGPGRRLRGVGSRRRRAGEPDGWVRDHLPAAGRQQLRAVLVGVRRVGLLRAHRPGRHLQVRVRGRRRPVGRVLPGQVEPGRGQPGHRRWRRHGAGRLDRGASLRGRHRDRRVRAPDPRHPGLGVRRHERCRGRRRLHGREGRLRAPRRSGPGQGLRVGLRRLRRRVVHRQGQLRDRGRRDRHRGRHAPGDRARQGRLDQRRRHQRRGRPARAGARLGRRPQRRDRQDGCLHHRGRRRGQPPRALLRRPRRVPLGVLQELVRVGDRDARRGRPRPGRRWHQREPHARHAGAAGLGRADRPRQGRHRCAGDRCLRLRVGHPQRAGQGAVRRPRPFQPGRRLHLRRPRRGRHRDAVQDPGDPGRGR